MRWHAPEAFFFLVALALLLLGHLWRWWSRARRMREVGDPGLMGAMAASSSLPAQVGKVALVISALVCIVLAVARPQLGGAEIRSEKRGIDLVLALDVSRSMAAQDVRPSRLKAARLAIEAALPKLAGSRLGLVPFSGVAFPQCPLTSDQAALRVYLQDLEPGQLPVGGTAVGRALAEASELLTGRRKLAEAARMGLQLEPLRRARTQAILLVTDGEDHQSDPLAAAEEAAKDGIRIFTVGMGTVSGEPLPLYNEDGSLQGYQRDREGKVVYSRLDEATLRQIAEKSGGAYLPFEGGRPFAERLADLIGSLEQESLGEGVRRHMDERYAYPLALALLLLALELLLGDRRKERKP